MNFDETMIQCPYCGEGLYIAIDPTEGLKRVFQEDCHVCCRCITIRLRIRKHGRYEIFAQTEDE